MILFLLGLVLSFAGLLSVLIFREVEEKRDVTELLESISPEQLRGLAEVLGPNQLEILKKMSDRREYKPEDPPETS